MSTVERKVRKPGLYDSQIIKAREVRSKAAVNRAALHNIKPILKEHVEWDMAAYAAELQGAHIAYTTKGDFTSCFRRGI